MAGHPPSKSYRLFLAPVALVATLSTVGCLKKAPEISASLSSGSSGGGSTGGGGTVAPINTTPKNVRISWTASKALGVPAGGYKVYVKVNAAPTTANTTPVTIANVGLVHTTSTTMPLAPGTYYISVSAYSADGDSLLSTPYLMQVP